MDASAITSVAPAARQELVRELAFPSSVRSGTAMRRPGGRTDPHLSAQPGAGSFLSPTAPGSFSGAAALRPPAAPA